MCLLSDRKKKKNDYGDKLWNQRGAKKMAAALPWDNYMVN